MTGGTKVDISGHFPPILAIFQLEQYKRCIPLYSSDSILLILEIRASHNICYDWVVTFFVLQQTEHSKQCRMAITSCFKTTAIKSGVHVKSQ